MLVDESEGGKARGTNLPSSSKATQKKILLEGPCPLIIMDLDLLSIKSLFSGIPSFFPPFVLEFYMLSGVIKQILISRFIGMGAPHVINRTVLWSS